MSNVTRGAAKMPTVAQLKEAIDRGEAGDKVDFPDPAASPLGTDAEAGGAAPTPPEVASAYGAEISKKTGAAPKSRTLMAVVGFTAIIAVAAVISFLVMSGP